MNSKIFPEAIDDGHEPHRRLAWRLNCSEELIDACSKGLGVPEWISSKHIDQVKEEIDALNKARQSAKNLARHLSRLDPESQQLLVQAGCITMYQIDKLAEELGRDIGQLDKFRATHPRPGGRNPAAYAVAKLVHRAFRVLGKPITWGVFEGSPSTEYGQTVDYAFGLFGIDSDWRRPAEAVRSEYLRRQMKTSNAIAEFKANQFEEN
ncbi:hypothetical protein [Roseovarius sp.]|uniref:hypothetical protein n=1 Tax=Roseovarius sp. TaxID=1486281 RepID=UPI003B58F2FB